MWRGTWFVDELCRNNVRGSSAVRESVNRRRRNQILESQFDTIRVE